MLKRFLTDERGQDAVEYSLLLVLIGAAAVYLLTVMGLSIGSILNKIHARLTTIDSAIK